MTRLQRSSLALVLIAAGLGAGIQFYSLVGLIPAIQIMPLGVYASSWHAMDSFMSVRMPPFMNFTLALYGFALICFARRWKSWLFWTLVGSLALAIADVVFTVKQQIPVNEAIAVFDRAHLNDMAGVEQMRVATVRNFRVREWFAISQFVWLACVAIFSAGADTPSGTRRGPGDRAAR